MFAWQTADFSWPILLADENGQLYRSSDASFIVMCRCGSGIYYCQWSEVTCFASCWHNLCMSLVMASSNSWPWPWAYTRDLWKLHNRRCTSHVSVVWQCKLVSGWRLRKRRSAPPYGSCGLGSGGGLYSFTLRYILLTCEINFRLITQRDQSGVFILCFPFFPTPPFPFPLRTFYTPFPQSS